MKWLQNGRNIQSDVESVDLVKMDGLECG